MASARAQPLKRSLPEWFNLPLALGMSVVALWMLAALTIDFWAFYEPLDMVAKRLKPPSAEHWLGTDALGRDVFTRTLYGAQYSIPIALVVVFTAVAIGSLLGALAGYFGGLFDAIVMRLVDVTMAFPPVLLAMAVVASLGPGLQNAAIAMVVVWWPVYARLLRAQVLDVKQREHVEAAVAAGVGQARLIRVHILPLCWTPTLINATMDFGQVVLLAASLSFIGLGAVPPTPEWGSMIADGAVHFYHWWIALGPGVAILSVVLGCNFLGDGLRDAFDPRTE